MAGDALEKPPEVVADAERAERVESAGITAQDGRRDLLRVARGQLGEDETGVAVAGVAGAALVSRMTAILPYALSFAAGAMVLVAVHELIPECQRNQPERPYLATMGIVAGFAVMMLLDVMLG